MIACLDCDEVVHVVVVEHRDPVAVGGGEARAALALHLAAVLHHRIQHRRRGAAQTVGQAAAVVPCAAAAAAAAAVPAVSAAETFRVPRLGVAAVTDTAASDAYHQEAVAERGAGAGLEALGAEAARLVCGAVHTAEDHVVFLKHLRCNTVKISHSRPK